MNRHEIPDIPDRIDETASPQQPDEMPKLELHPDRMLERLRDPHFLPSHEDINMTFPSEGGLFGAGHERWRNFCHDEKAPVYEFFNSEFINAFGDYLTERANELGGTAENPVTILEVGAGNGRFSHFLRERFGQVGADNVRIIATDSGSWGIKQDFEVEQLEQQEALEKYNPQIVVFSWMPYQEDYTGSFRQHPSVQEYLLIGETDGGCCGDEWLTWGYAWSFDDEDEQTLPPYEQDGFSREDLDDVSRYQICRTDDPGHYYHSTTVSFKRS